MAEYSVDICRELAGRFDEKQLRRPMRVDRYDAGDVLTYNVTGVIPDKPATVKVKINKFVGGGFAGQVYRVDILEVDAPDGEIPSLEVGRKLAMKILIPPSKFSVKFRNLVYGVGFQGPFQLQVNPTAARAGALLQKFIRRAASKRFCDDKCVNDIIATFVDDKLGSCGEFSDWVDGRTWRMEVDDHADLLKKWKRGLPVDENLVGSPEYRSKHKFMTEFVEMLHEMGAHEFARQYEWTTCKSQPNCLKRSETGDDPLTGLIAVDFRAGLALLPFLPMSPGDLKLIAGGVKRGSLVQFDRGNLDKLEKYMDARPDDFADMRGAFEQLKETDKFYRDSLPDVTHNHVRLLGDGRLWGTIFKSAVTGWRVRNIIDEDAEQKFHKSKFKTFFFFLLGLISSLCSLAATAGLISGVIFGAMAIFGNRPDWLGLAGCIAANCFLGGLILAAITRLLRRFWGRPDLRDHYTLAFTSLDYFQRAFSGRMIEKLVVWHRSGRINERRALHLAGNVGSYIKSLPLSVLPTGLYRMITDKQYRRERLHYILVRPVKLYFKASMREQWLHDMVAAGKKNHLLTDEDADIILGQINEPFIQKYLKSLAVHVCTLPVTQVVSVICAAIYCIIHYGEPNTWAIGLGILAAFQLTPISPGSICRGLYVLYLVIKERNFKDYNIAVFLGFFKYVGYLAFPIQMAYHYPVLARFMAAHWATGAVHVVPVFGEKGALLEHWVFTAFYNKPLTLRRRMAKRAEIRANQKPRRWHLAPVVAAAVAIIALSEHSWLANPRSAPLSGSQTTESVITEAPEGEAPVVEGPTLPNNKDVWLVIGLTPFLIGGLTTMFAGGAVLSKRIIQGIICAIVAAVISIFVRSALGTSEDPAVQTSVLMITGLWRCFIFSIISVIGVIITELNLPEPVTR